MKPDSNYDPSHDEEDPFDPEEHEGREDGEYDNMPPPASEYTSLVEQWEYREASQEGKYPYINLAVSIFEGEYEKRWLWDILSYSPKSGFRWAAVFKALGWTKEHGKIDRKNMDELARWFDSGRLFRIKTYVDSYRTTVDGVLVSKKTAKIKKFIGPDEREEPLPLDGPVAQEKAEREQSKESGGQYYDNSSSQDEDDDMPF